jgi:hypothetical protein
MTTAIPAKIALTGCDLPPKAVFMRESGPSVHQVRVAASVPQQRLCAGGQSY